MKKNVYISGPISGFFLEERIWTFCHAAEMVEKWGHQAVNPFDNGLPHDADYTQHMKADIKMLLGCDGILMLPDWQQSAGAQLELRVAMACGLELWEVKVYWATDEWMIQQLSVMDAEKFLL